MGQRSEKTHLLVKCEKTTDMYLSTATATVEKVEPAREILEKLRWDKLRLMTVNCLQCKSLLQPLPVEQETAKGQPRGAQIP